jgi:penicillin-binding protein 2
MAISRLILPKLTVLLIFAVLVGRLYQLQLVDSEADRFRYATQVRTRRYLPVRPMRGEVFASDGKTRLAETVPIFTVSIRPADLPPADSIQRAQVFVRLGQLLGITSTLTISPAAALEQDPVLRSDIAQGLGQAVLSGARRSTAAITSTQVISAPGGLGTTAPPAWIDLSIPPARLMDALRLSSAYTGVLQLVNPIAEHVAQGNIPGYQTLSIKRDIPRDVAFVLRENAASLPGVVVEQDFQRRYPLSGQIQSLSHMLGYIGRIDECELASENPARSWVIGMLDSIAHAADCGIISKQINPYQLGVPLYLNDDRIGKDGIEASYEKELHGQLGYQAVVVDAMNHPVRAPQVIRPVRAGNNLTLTIDAPLQRQVEQILRNWIDESDRRRTAQTGPFLYKRNYQPIRSGAAVVMDVRNGNILAMVSWPAYDNNIWVDPQRAQDLQNLLAPPLAVFTETQRLAPLTNRVIAGQYPPGSTLKQFDAAILLQKGVIGPDTQVRDPGRLVLEDQYVAGRLYSYPNSTPRDNGKITVTEALMRSSNVFFMSAVGGNKDDHVVNLKPDEKTIDGLPIKDFAAGLGWFGFGQPTGIRLAGEHSGRVPTPAWKQEVLRQTWTTGDTYNAAIGQGNLEVTPLQLVTAAAAVANGGTIYRPQIIAAISDVGGHVIQATQPEVVGHVPVEPSNFGVVREGMRRSVTEGVNIAARDQCSGLQIAGKTGTAEFGPVLSVPTADGRGTQHVRQSHSWFVGFAPYDQPQIEVLALVEGSGDLGDGSATITVPAVTQIMQAYFRVTPPNPLPQGCQQGMPALPPRVEIAPQ